MTNNKAIEDMVREKAEEFISKKGELTISDLSELYQKHLEQISLFCVYSVEDYDPYVGMYHTMIKHSEKSQWNPNNYYKSRQNRG